MNTYNLADIKPIGNFDWLLKELEEKVDEIEKEGYSKRVSKAIKTIVSHYGLTEILADFEEPYSGWDREEQKICLLFTHILIIRLNNIAQKALNNIDMSPIPTQLMEWWNSDKTLTNLFGPLTITT